MNNQKPSQDRFPFEEGQQVRVRVRENGTSGNIIAKFEATCVDILNRKPGHGAPVAIFKLPWRNHEKTRIKPYEAEFEVLNEQ